MTAQRRSVAEALRRQQQRNSTAQQQQGLSLSEILLKLSALFTFL